LKYTVFINNRQASNYYTIISNHNVVMMLFSEK
jgi:hypothetical protein